MHRSVRPQLHDVAACPHGSIARAELGALGVRRPVLDFSVNTNPLGPPPGVARALAAVEIARYPDPDATELRARLAERLDVPVGSLIAGNGSAELIWLTALAFVEPDDRVLIVGPTFGEYERACAIMGAQVIHYRAVPTTAFRPDAAHIEKLVVLFQPKLVFLCNPNNPTGVLLQPDWIRELASAANGLIVADEAYAAFAPGYRSLAERGAGSGVLVLRSLTKDYAVTGLRLGYAVGAPEVIAALETVRPPWSVNAMAQAAGTACLDDRAHLARSLEAVEAARSYLVTALAELGLAPLPSAANFFLLEVGDAAEFRRRLLGRGCCVRDCSSFGIPRHVRIGLRSLAECRILVQAIAAELATGEGTGP